MDGDGGSSSVVPNRRDRKERGGKASRPLHFPISTTFYIQRRRGPERERKKLKKNTSTLCLSRRKSMEENKKEKASKGEVAPIYETDRE